MNAANASQSVLARFIKALRARLVIANTCETIPCMALLHGVLLFYGTAKADSKQILRAGDAR